MTISQASASDRAHRAFESLHPEVQRWIYDQGWPSLRSIQVEAIEAIRPRDRDLVIAAPTAGGKTEAAFLPILSDLAQHEGSGLRCLALSPLRALINDQARRLLPLCERLDLRFQAWHGDITAGRATFWRQPPDVLMTTPESLEAFLMNHGARFGPLCAGLRFVVVDEIHAFFGTERGAQLRSLIARLERYMPASVPRVALSATLADPVQGAAFLRWENPERCQVITGTAGGSGIRIALRVVPLAAPATQIPDQLSDAGDGVDEDGSPLGPLPLPPSAEQLALEDPEGSSGTGLDVEKDPYIDALYDVTKDLYQRLRGESHLVFANSRSHVEYLAARLREVSERQGVPNEFFAHHGSLARDDRMLLEDRLRDGTLPTTAICTSTLEMGIDIGDVKTISQVGPPPRVASLKQRMGRSGRRAGTAQTLRQYVLAPTLDSRSHHLDYLRLPLLKAVASIELMLEGKFESVDQGELHLSTLVQQILSSMMENGGGITAPLLHETLCVRGPFRRVDAALFAQVLRGLGAAKVIEQVAGGELLPGPVGEQLVGHYSFYAAFQASEEWQLFAGERRLGALPVVEILVPGRYLIFSGRRWRIESVDDRAKVVMLEPAKGGKPPQFGGGAVGEHAIVHQAMRRILIESTAVPPYLDARAAEVLAEARRAATNFGVKRSIYANGSNGYLAHWAGTRVGNTIALLVQARGCDAQAIGPFVQMPGSDEAGARELIGELLAMELPNAADLASKVENLIVEKHDPHLSREVLIQAYAARSVDIDGARVCLLSVQSDAVAYLDPRPGQKDATDHMRADSGDYGLSRDP